MVRYFQKILLRARQLHSAREAIVGRPKERYEVVRDRLFGRGQRCIEVIPPVLMDQRDD
jgi:hypothetical protein